MNRPFKRLFGSLALLVAVAALAMAATTSVFAFHSGSQSNATNGGPLNTTGVVAPTSITPGGSASYTSTYSYTVASPPAGAYLSGAGGGSIASAPAGQGFPSSTVSGSNTSIGTMWQQWRHNTAGMNMDRWFYAYAGNQNFYQALAASMPTGTTPGPQQGGTPASAPVGQTVMQSGAGNSAATAPAVFSYFYYTREAGQVVFASFGPSGATLGPDASRTQTGGAAIGIVFLDTARTFPIATIRNMGATVLPCSQTNVGQTCQANLQVLARWGVPQNAWPAGNATLLQAVESGPIINNAVVLPNTAGATFFYDQWNVPQTLVLGNTAPVVAGLTNVGSFASPAARSAGTSFESVLSITDTNADIEGGSMVFVFTSGPRAAIGEWFQIGYTNGDNQDNALNVGTGRAFYVSAHEDPQSATFNSGLGTTNPIGGRYATFTASANCTVVPATGNTGGCSAESITFVVTYTATSVGNTATVFGRAGDFHGGTSGNVRFGAVTITS